jgi:hypothetical protein
MAMIEDASFRKVSFFLVEASGTRTKEGHCGATQIQNTKERV